EPQERPPGSALIFRIICVVTLLRVTDSRSATPALPSVSRACMVATCESALIFAVTNLVRESDLTFAAMLPASRGKEVIRLTPDATQKIIKKSFDPHVTSSLRVLHNRGGIGDASGKYDDDLHSQKIGRDVGRQRAHPSFLR